MRRLLTLLLSVAILAPLLIPLLTPGTLFQFDMLLHLERITAFYRALREGIIPPTWSTYLAWGYGSPVLIYNWSFPYYIASIFLQAGSTLVDAYKWMTAMSYIGAYLMMFVFLSDMLPAVAALVGATWYVWVPYRFNINELRGAIGEEFALVFWPGVFWAVLLIFRRSYRKGFLIGALCWALLVWSHTPLFGMIVPIWLLFLASRWLITRDAKAVLVSIASIGTGMAILAYSWVPILFERNLLQYGMHEMIFQTNYITWTQVFLQPGVLDFGIPRYLQYYSVGWPVLAIVFFSVVTLVWSVGKKVTHRVLSLVIFVLSTLIGIYFAMHASAPVWATLPLLAPTINFPQRFLGLVGFSASILAALHVAGQPKKMRFIIGVLLVAAIIVSSYPYLSLNQNRVDTLAALNHPELTTTDVWGEFRTKRAPLDFRDNHMRYTAIPLISITPPSKTPPFCTQNSVAITCTIRTTAPSTVSLRQFYFPGWAAYADTERVALEPGPNGTILLTLPRPATAVKIVYEGTPLENTAKWISFIALIFFLGFAIQTVYTSGRTRRV